MNNYELLIDRICSNRLLFTIDGKNYCYKSPSEHLRYRSSILYNEILEENRFEEWISKDEARLLLIRNGFFSFDIENSIKELEKVIDNLKIDLYKSAFSGEKERLSISKRLKLSKDKHHELLNKLHMLDQYTLEGYARLVKIKYLLLNSVYYKGKKIHCYKLPAKTLEKIISKINQNLLDYTTIRELAKSDIWSSIWRASNGRPFIGKAISWSEEQKNLILISKMYDSVYKSSECPPDEVIKNDDMLDGWLLLQQREHEKKKNTKLMEDSGKFAKNKNNRGGETFIVANNVDEASRINSMNDNQALAIKAQRQALINKQGEAKDGQFLDKKLEFQAQAKEKFMKNVKGG